LVRAPEVCVEVFSASNTFAEIAEKIVLYFEAGAQEVWTCDQDGILEFHFAKHPEIRQPRSSDRDFHPPSGFQVSDGVQWLLQSFVGCARYRFLFVADHAMRVSW
jgi:Uma2 family endonuclease